MEKESDVTEIASTSDIKNVSRRNLAFLGTKLGAFVALAALPLGLSTVTKKSYAQEGLPAG